MNINGPKKLKFWCNIYWQLSSEFIPSWKRQHKEGRQNSLEDSDNIQVFIFSYQSFSKHIFQFDNANIYQVKIKLQPQLISSQILFHCTSSSSFIGQVS